MPARDASDGGNQPEADGQGRASAGGARFFGEHWRTLAVAAVVGLVALAALRGAGDGQDGGDGAQDARGGEDPSADAGADADGAPSVPDATGPDGLAASTTSTLVPPDVAHERPVLDLDVVPPGSDPIEVARWWAGNYAAYVGAEAPADLANRLAPLTSPAFLESIRALPPAASYDVPIEVEGVTGTELSRGQQTMVVRVSIESVAALVVYDVNLSEAQPGSWRVDQATRV